MLKSRKILVFSISRGMVVKIYDFNGKISPNSFVCSCLVKSLGVACPVKWQEHERIGCLPNNPSPEVLTDSLLSSLRATLRRLVAG